MISHSDWFSLPLPFLLPSTSSSTAPQVTPVWLSALPSTSPVRLVNLVLGLPNPTSAHDSDRLPEAYYTSDSVVNETEEKE